MIKNQAELATQQRILSTDDTRVQTRKSPFTTLNVTATAIGSAQDFHVVPIDQAVLVDRLSACNVTGSAVDLSVYAVPSGASAGVTNAALVAFSIAANDTVDVGAIIGGMWGPGDTVKVFCGTSGAITLSGFYGQLY